MTHKNTAEHSKAACLGIYWPECDVYIAHTTIKPEVSISLTEMPFFILQVNFHTSNDFCDWRLLNFHVFINVHKSVYNLHIQPLSKRTVF